MIINTEICGHYERVMRPAPDERLVRFLDQVGRRAMVMPLVTDDGERRRFVWILDVPEEDLLRVHNEATALSLSLYDPEPVPFGIGVADQEKTDEILLARYDTLRPDPLGNTERE